MSGIRAALRCAIAGCAIAGCAMLAWTAADAMAREATAGEKSALASTIARFDAGMKALDFGVIADIMPPAIVKLILASGKLDRQQFRASLQAQMQKTAAQVKFESFKMDAASALWREDAKGAPYALVPTETIMITQGRRVRAVSHTLALIDDGQWYLLRVESPQHAAVLKQAYPALANIAIPPGKMESDPK